MPPKSPPTKGKKNKKDKKSKYPIIVDGIVTNDMTREELETYIVTIRRELEKERNERNLFQLERDKVNNFWEITRRQLEDEKIALMNKERELEDAEEKHQLELKVYRQKVKHLMYEHENTEAGTRADKLTAIHQAENNFKIDKIELRQFSMNLKTQLRQKQLESEEATKFLKREYENELTNLRENFINKSKELDQAYQEKMKTQREEIHLRRKTEIHEVEERKNVQIRTLIEHHDEAFRAMKNFYNEITLNNINIIKTLKENIELLRKKILSTENKLEFTNQDLKRKIDFCNRLEYTLGELSRTKALLENERMAHKISNGHVKRLTKENKELKFENELVTTQFNILDQERMEMRKKCQSCLLDVQQKSSFRALLLERKLGLIKDELEKKEVQLNQVLSIGNIDKEAELILRQRIEDVLDFKNQTIRDLQIELARSVKQLGLLKKILKRQKKTLKKSLEIWRKKNDDKLFSIADEIEREEEELTKFLDEFEAQVKEELTYLAGETNK